MIVEAWTATEVKALRVAALRMTREQFGERLGWAASTVQKWEHGGARRVLGDRAATLDTALAGLTAPELERFTAALTAAAWEKDGHPEGTAAAPSTDEEDDMRRRDFGILAIAAATTRVGPSRISRGDASRLEAIGAELEATAQRSGGANLVSDGTAALRKGLALLDSGTFDAPTGRLLVSAVGQLAAQTGWLAYDADQHALARHCFTEALSLAGTVDDDWLTASVCLTAASQPIALARKGKGSACRALPLTSRAADAMRRHPPSRIHALVAVREAAALGVMGDSGGFDRAIATAWRELERAEQHESVDECPAWLRFVTAQEIRGHEARGCASLGRSHAALNLYEVANTERASPGNRANTGAWTALARTQIGDLDGALVGGMSVLTQLESVVASPRTLKVLVPVRKAVQSLPAATEFCARLDRALNAEGTVSA
ncbi:helix-turn-helix domain-containing protein [Nocardia callitridis]|uniref:HTH cro/C1-type domain-containing protein n=1 Tax=Nocardia callitridis TaxID=648753 RepID=A0ABP9JTF6_9NOCA